VRLNLPAQGMIDRRVPYAPFLGKRVEIRDPDDPGTVLEVLLLEIEASSGEHHPGDPSPFLHPGTLGWVCTPAYGGLCSWVGYL
jgi:hypothetical protein